MQIKLNDIQFSELNYQVNTYDKDVTHQDINTSLNIEKEFSVDNKKSFRVVFHFSAQSESFNLQLKATAHFSTLDDIQEKDKFSTFLNVTAPAVAFPYVRTFISNLTLNTGYAPIVLPTFNFVQMQEK